MALHWFKRKDKSVPPVKEGTAGDTFSESPDRQETDPKPNIAVGSAPPNGHADLSKGGPSPVSSNAQGFLSRLKRGLTKTRDFLNTDIDDLFRGKNRIDDEMLEEIEELLITSDIGIQTVMELMNSIHRRGTGIEDPAALKQHLKEEMLALLNSAVPEATIAATHKPHITMVVGVNGVGKTTTIGKLASKHTHEGQSVLIAAADTFRAAAVEQLAVWAERAGAGFVRHKENADPAAVAYDSVEAALARGTDRVFIDTAGRLHTKINLMEELKKIQRTIRKKIPDAPHETLLVLDATTGQNAVSQAKMFHEALGITGLALTKLDGTAKGGIVISICRQLKLPLLYIGVGEAIEDLQPFDAHHFIDALF
jgi:fused signal recognition particle receptor